MIKIFHFIRHFMYLKYRTVRAGTSQNNAQTQLH